MLSLRQSVSPGSYLVGDSSCHALLFLAFDRKSLSDSVLRQPGDLQSRSLIPVASVKSWPVYHHEIMRRFYADWVLASYHSGRSQPVVAVLVKGIAFWFFSLGRFSQFQF